MTTSGFKWIWDAPVEKAEEKDLRAELTETKFKIAYTNLLLYFFLVVLLFGAIFLFATYGVSAASSSSSSSSLSVEPISHTLFSSAEKSWFESNIIQLASMLIVGLASFFGIKIAVKIQGEKIHVLEEKITKMESDLSRHKGSERPHTHCIVHTSELKSVTECVADKVDASLCKTIHKNVDEKFAGVIEDIQDIKISLTSLSEIKTSLVNIERAVSNGAFKNS